jgi:hypothetical protein
MVVEGVGAAVMQMLIVEKLATVWQQQQQQQ